MDTVKSLARHVGQLLAGYLTARGTIDGTMEEVVIGIIVSVATLGWYLYDKKKAA